MRVVCPACAAAYEVPASVVEAGRTVRCTSCGSQFSASAAPAAQAVPPATRSRPAPPAPLAPDPEAIRASGIARLPTSVEAAAHAPRARRAVVAGWVLSLVLLAAGAGAALAWRQPIMRAWPPSTRAYAALGYAH